MNEIIFRDESYRIIGACFEVFKEKGCGFTEPVYQECLAIEFGFCGIPFVREPKIPLVYRGQKLDQFFRPDFICYDAIVVELKATSNLLPVHRSQAMNYLNALTLDLALLVNFGAFPKLEYERMINRRTQDTKSLRDELRSWLE